MSQVISKYIARRMRNIQDRNNSAKARQLERHTIKSGGNDWDSAKWIWSVSITVALHDRVVRV